MKVLYIGASPDTAVPYPVDEAAWMPRGWKLKLNGIDTIEQAQSLSSAEIFADRAALPATGESEYLVGDIVGFAAVDADSGEPLGSLVGIETIPGADRWWFALGDDEIPVPALKRFIVKVDAATRTIHLRHLDELR